MSKFGERRLYKICLLGDGGVGKTSLRYRYLGEGFKANYMATIGADFAVKHLGDKMVAQIWDLAGQERFSVVREGYYKGTKGALMVFDITRPDTFRNIPNWIGELMENTGEADVLPMVLIGNKSDLRVEGKNFVTPAQGKAYAKQLADWAELDIPYIETSAKTGLNVQEIFDVLIENIQYRQGAQYSG